MTEVAAVTAISGKAFVGDTSFGRRNRQVLLIDSGTLSEFGTRPGDARENVTFEGFNLSGLAPQQGHGTKLISTGQVLIIPQG